MLACTLLLASSLAIAGPIPVVNPGFETGDFTGWTQSGNPDFTSVVSGSANSGTYFGHFGPIGSLGFIAQNVPTVPGGAYDITFYLLNTGPSSTNTVELWWDGSLAATWTDPNPTVWTIYGWPNLVTGSSSTELKLGFRNDPGFFYLDDVAVNASIPEPSTLALLGTGVLLLLLRRRK